MWRRGSLVAALALSAALSAQPAAPRWYKGNTHTHTLRSDGDASPEDVVRWYREHGYDFLVITDHNKVTLVDGGGLLLIPGEEVTDRLPKKPLHVCAIGIERAVAPQGGTTPVDVMQHNIDAVREAGGIAAINHPNFGWALTAGELQQLERATLLEIASGHPLVNMAGPPSSESLWDAMLTRGRRVWGIAVDDAHHYHCEPPKGELLTPPGQGWVMVRAESLTREAIVAALARGELYASTGVVIESIDASPRAIRVTMADRYAAKYRTQFIGRGGKLLAETEGKSATYRIRGDEGYVRAKVTDSNGKAAWLQPVWVTP